MSRRFLLWGALWLTGCPGTGGTECDGGVCAQADSGSGGSECKGTDPAGAPANLILNPGFECGSPPSSWFSNPELSITTEASGARSGSKAARLSAPNGGAAINLWPVADAVSSPGTKTYCANAWMKGNALTGRLTVVRVKPGTVEYETFSLPLTNDWLPNPPAATHALKVTGKDEERLLLRIWIPNARPGDFMVVDDVQLWESADGTCSER